MAWILLRPSNYKQVAPLVRTGGSRHTGLAALPHRNIHSENKSEKKLTTDILKQLSEEYETKSNWDRYFSDKLQGETSGRFMKEWSSLSCLEKITYLDDWITKKDVLKV